MLIPNYHQVIVQPQFEMIKRLNNTIYQPLLRSCSIIDSFITSTELSKMTLKVFKNNSMTFMEHAFMSPDRLRGISGASCVYVDECQDMNWEFIPIIAECMSASINWGFSIYTGTPKTTDGTLAMLWSQSSQAEWVIRCDACGAFNIPNPEQHLLKMIGKHGPVCYKCGKPLTIEHGGWVHSYPDRALTFPSYHLAQPVHKLHSINDNKWQKLLHKVNTFQTTTLYNEVFGWPYDDATTPLTLNDLISAEYEPVDEFGTSVDIKHPSDIRKVASMYSYITVGCDWGGGSAISDSYTAFAVIGLRKDNQVIDVLYSERIPKGVTPTDEARILLNWIQGSGANAFAFDNGGAGFVRTEIMKHEGLMEIPGLVICPQQYGPPSGGDIMKLSKAKREADMTYYITDKSRSLAMCIAGIKSKRIRNRIIDNRQRLVIYHRNYKSVVLKLRIKKNVVNLTRQSPCGVLNNHRIGLGIIGNVGAKHNIARSSNCIDRSSQFMRHVR
jgi:hypothetical protein